MLAHETQGNELHALRVEFAQLTQTVRNLEKRCSSMEQFFADNPVRTWEGVNDKSALVFEDVDGIRRGLRDNPQRSGVLLDFPQGIEGLVVAKTSDTDTLPPLIWETEQEHEESPSIESEVRSLHRDCNPAIPSTLPPVPRRETGASRKRSPSFIVADAASSTKRRRAE
jgi:hypothetical protein